MPYIAPTTRADGYVVDATEWNKNTVENPIALRAGEIAVPSAAVGDLITASSTTQLGRVADVATGQVLQSGGVGVAPAYSPTLNISSASGGQIVFPAAQNASANANTLDDYEEATWTPVIGGSGGTSGQTYGSQTGTAVKIGQLVMAWFDVTLTAKGTITTSVQIQGLPFTSGGQGTAHVAYWENLATATISIAGLVGASGTAVTLYFNTAAATTRASMTTTDIGNTTRLAGMVSYRAAT